MPLQSQIILPEERRSGKSNLNPAALKYQPSPFVGVISTMAITLSGPQKDLHDPAFAAAFDSACLSRYTGYWTYPMTF